MSEFEDFFENDDNFLIINGPAGTGKTSLISKSIKECEKLNLKYEAVAYTGKAASNLRSKCDGTGKTIHDFLYTFASKPKPSGEGYGKDWILDFSDLDILFIDECSMLSTQVPGFKVNGEKTYLFLEILEALKSRKIKKIMLLGDRHQLPPIYKEENKKEDEDTEEIEDNLTENLFPDSMNELFLKNEFGLKGKTINLDTNWRYQEDFQAYKLSIQLRQHITIKNSFVSSPKKWITPKVDKNKLTGDENKVIEWVAERGSENTFNNIRILTFTNDKADEWNRKLRRFLGKIDKDTGDVEGITIGEPMMNLYNKEYSKFYNGDSFAIKEFIDKPYSLQGDSNCERHQACIRESVSRPYELFVQKANISLFNEDGNEEKTVSLVSKGVKANDEKTKKAYHLRVWCDFATRNDNLYKKQKDPSEEDVLEWNEKRNNDEIYGTGIACYAYASTVHKTQGDSFEYVVIDLEDEDRNLKWLYTALTRTTVDFLLYGKKSFSDWF